AGTVKVKEINGTISSSPLSLTGVGNTLYFSANDGTNTELWKSDGSDAGTGPITPLTHQPTSPTNLTKVGNDLYFVGTGVSTGAELWVTNGTAAGTHIVKDIENGINGSSPTEITDFLGRPVLVATTVANGA